MIQKNVLLIPWKRLARVVVGAYHPCAAVAVDGGDAGAVVVLHSDRMVEVDRGGFHDDMMVFAVDGDRTGVGGGACVKMGVVADQQAVPCVDDKAGESEFDCCKVLLVGLGGVCLIDSVSGVVEVQHGGDMVHWCLDNIEGVVGVDMVDGDAVQKDVPCEPVDEATFA